MNNYVGPTIYNFTHAYSHVYLNWVHIQQHLNNQIDVTNMQVKGLIF